MNTLGSIITYVRRIIKSPSNSTISDELIIDYINRFWLIDMDARLQLFDLKTKYQFQTTPGIDQYNMPLYNVQTQPGEQDIESFPVYQGFMAPAFVNGIQVPFYTQRNSFLNMWPNYTQSLPNAAIGDGGQVYTINLPFFPALTGHVDITGIISSGSNVDPIFGNTINTSIPSTSIYPAVYFNTSDSYGNNVVVQDSGQFLQVSSSKMPNLGLLMIPGPSPFGYSAMPNGYANSFSITNATQASSCVLTCTNNFVVGQEIEISGVLGMTELNGNTYTITAVTATTITINVDSTSFTAYSSGGTASSIVNVINYQTGVATVIFPVPIPSGTPIQAQCYFITQGLPRAILYHNNTLTLRSPPNTQYLVELDAYLTPAAFLNTGAAIPFAYMAEYIARGAARKILSDTGDIEQFQFYEPLFREQENLVWKRSQRQWTATRTETIYSQGTGQGLTGNNTFGGTI